MKSLCFIILLLVGMAASHAQTCASFHGTISNTDSIDTIISKVSTIPNRRGEYEPTVQFNERRTNAITALKLIYIVDTKIDSKYILYDADTQAFSISSYAIDNETTSWEAVFDYGKSLEDQVEFDYVDNVDIVLSSHESVTGTYTAQNAAGISAKISVIQRVKKGIFDHKSKPRGEDLFFPNREANKQANNIIGSIAVPLAHARAMKDDLKAAVVISPRSPFYGRGEKRWGRPTLSRPEDVKEDVYAVIADIQCALLMDKTNRVLLAIPTQ